MKIYICSVHYCYGVIFIVFNDFIDQTKTHFLPYSMYNFQIKKKTSKITDLFKYTNAVTLPVLCDEEPIKLHNMEVRSESNISR